MQGWEKRNGRTMKRDIYDEHILNRSFTYLMGYLECAILGDKNLYFTHEFYELIDGPKARPFTLLDNKSPTLGFTHWVMERKSLRSTRELESFKKSIYDKACTQNIGGESRFTTIFVDAAETLGIFE